jgi:hypothetical protein
MLEVMGKEDGYTYRWVRKDLLDKRTLEGWEPVVATKRSRVEAPESTIIDGTPLSTYVVKRGLVLCRMTKERVEERTKYYRRLSQGAIRREVEDLEAQAKVGDYPRLGAYGEIKISVGED